MLKRNLGIKIAAALLLPNVLWLWPGTFSARSKWRWIVGRYDRMTITERLDCHDLEVWVGDRRHRITPADVSAPAGPYEPPQAEQWYVDLLDPFVRYHTESRPLVCGGRRWRLSSRGWVIDAHFGGS